MPTITSAGGAIGLPFMRFTLIYDGELSSSGNGSKKTRQKWALRKVFHPQLEELWRTNRILRELQRDGIHVPRNRSFSIEQHHHLATNPEPFALPPAGMDLWNLVEPIERYGRKYQPLVRESMALSCFLKILFLRKEEPGALVLQGGDLDNRVKTLFDGLRMPADPVEVVDDPTAPEPFHCLLESDAMITGFEIKSDRLLSRPNSSVHDARLVIDVNVNVTTTMLYNMHFLGD